MAAARQSLWRHALRRASTAVRRLRRLGGRPDARDDARRTSRAIRPRSESAVGGLRQIGSVSSRNRMAETIQLAGDECAVARFGVTPSESIWDVRILNVPARNNQCRCWVKTGNALTERNISAEPSRPDICASRIGETLPGTSSGTSASVDRNIWPTAISIIGLSHDLDATTGSVASAPMPLRRLVDSPARRGRQYSQAADQVRACCRRNSGSTRPWFGRIPFGGHSGRFKGWGSGLRHLGAI